jgi:hypothetical protein
MPSQWRVPHGRRCILHSQVATMQKFRKTLPEEASVFVCKNNLMKVAVSQTEGWTLLSDKGCTVCCGRQLQLCVAHTHTLAGSTWAAAAAVAAAPTEFAGLRVERVELISPALVVHSAHACRARTLGCSCLRIACRRL